MKHLLHLRARFEPSGHVERLLFGFAQPKLHGAQTAQRQKHVLRAGAHGEIGEGVMHARPEGLGCGHEPQQQIGMA